MKCPYCKMTMRFFVWDERPNEWVCMNMKCRIDKMRLNDTGEDW